MADSINNPMPPLWLKYPHISRYSIGWRMGYGEGYSIMFHEWLDTLSEDEKHKYRAMFPEPREWTGYYDDDCIDDALVIYENLTYSKEWLIKKCDKNQDCEFVFFWKPGDSPEDCLGQWQHSFFKEDIYTFSCAEQYMMAHKAVLFEDKEMFEKILANTDPKEMKALGRKIRNFEEDIWEKEKYPIVLQGNYRKFSQNKGMLDYLLSTGDKILVEASPLDRIWGIGIGRNNPDAENPLKWRGQNLLGFALMEVRDELRAVYENYNKADWLIYQDE